MLFTCKDKRQLKVGESLQIKIYGVSAIFQLYHGDQF
jgi:hypothetical protein